MNPNVVCPVCNVTAGNRFEKFAKELVNQLNSVTDGKKVKQETEKWTDFFKFTKLSTNAIRITMWPHMDTCTKIDSKSYQSASLDLGVRGAKFKCCIFVIDSMKPSILTKNSNDNNIDATSDDLPPQSGGVGGGGPRLSTKTSKDLFDEILSSNQKGRKGDLTNVHGYLTHLMYLRDNKLFNNECEMLILCDNAHNNKATQVNGMYS